MYSLGYIVKILLELLLNSRAVVAQRNLLFNGDGLIAKNLYIYVTLSEKHVLIFYRESFFSYENLFVTNFRAHKQ